MTVRRERTLHACFVALCREAPCSRRDVRICEGTSGSEEHQACEYTYKYPPCGF